MQVTTRSDGKPNKSCCDIRTRAETKTGGTSKEDNVVTRKEDIVGRNGEIMSLPKSKAEWTCNVSARQFQVAIKIQVGDFNQGRDLEFMS